MGKDITVYRPPPSDQLHPLVYKVAVGFVLCFVVSAWIFFDRRSFFEQQNDSGPLLAVASYLLLVAVALPLVLWRVWRKYKRRTLAGDEAAPFRNWAAGEFDAQGSRLKGSHAAIEALLPIAAVACGLLALGIVFVLTAAASAA
jgi:hypothetical protein